MLTPFFHCTLPAIMGARTVVDFFLTECGMSINACSSTRQYTVMHQLARSIFNPTEHLSMAAWLVEERGADLMSLNSNGYTAARLALA